MLIVAVLTICSEWLSQTEMVFQSFKVQGSSILLLLLLLLSCYMLFYIYNCCYCCWKSRDNSPELSVRYIEWSNKSSDLQNKFAMNSQVTAAFSGMSEQANKLGLGESQLFIACYGKYQVSSASPKYPSVCIKFYSKNFVCTVKPGIHKHVVSQIGEMFSWDKVKVPWHRSCLPYFRAMCIYIYIYIYPRGVNFHELTCEIFCSVNVFSSSQSHIDDSVVFNSWKLLSVKRGDNSIVKTKLSWIFLGYISTQSVDMHVSAFEASSAQLRVQEVDS